MLWHASFKNIVEIFKIHFGIKSKKRGLFILMQIPENFWTMSPRVLPMACLRIKKGCALINRAHRCQNAVVCLRIDSH
ncbi:hypothetical protein HMP0721_0650 [Pseudoramibacter alactolyticus ATCC 23263]|uniref:Uncharacterized protein n=1 Tax=Pseudoramibacter alactolyticus ATCC 23263 TaxID=887929 RepID=E6MF67_9FIRM|nr:hypothetical protein HMP0721_0650 [Pseudoramibacter alactolyticus ATCC 23263]